MIPAEAENRGWFSVYKAIGLCILVWSVFAATCWVIYDRLFMLPFAAVGLWASWRCLRPRKEIK